MNDLNEKQPDNGADAEKRMLLNALWQALRMRGIFAALNDPLLLPGEKVELREMFKAIEAQIREAIKKAER